MVSRRSSGILAVSAALAAMLSSPVLAGDRGHGWGHHHRHHHHRHQRIEGSVNSGLPSIIPGLGTYSGAVSALRVRGHGIYFSVSGLGGKQPARLRPKARIIDVSSGIADPCQYQAGVCVIRP